MSSQAVAGSRTGRAGGLPAYGDGRRIVNAGRWFALALVLALAAAPAAAQERIRILAFGDSLTAGYGLAQEDSFPAQLQTALRARGIDAEVINAGVSGDTTAGGLARLDWTLASPADFAIVELGANDALRGLDPAAAEANLDAILGRLRQAGIGVLLAGMLAPRNLGPEYGAQFDPIFPRLADRHGVAFYPFFLDGVAGKAELNLPDGMHPNAAGVAQIVRRILPHVVKLTNGET